MDARDRAKRAAAVAAVDTYCKSGMRLGLGSGTTSREFVRVLAERVHHGLDVIGVPSSLGTAKLARELGVPLVDLDDVPRLDLTVDGAVEIDRRGDMVKGAGGSFLREKIVARASVTLVVVADDAKLVPRLGAPVPIEVVPFGRVSTQRLVARLLADLGYGEVELTWRQRAGELVATDNGHYVLDAKVGDITDAAALTRRLNEVPGVVENGLFVDVASDLVVGHADGSVELVPLPMR